MSKRIVDIDDQTYDMIRLHCILSCDQREALMNAIEISKPYDNSGDLISREALKDEVRKHAEYFADRTEEDRYNVGYTECACEVLDFIDNAPTVQAFTLEDMQNNYDAGVDSVIGKYDKAKGEWIFRKGVTCGGYYKCNKCGEVERAEKNYCPNCGALMKGGAE